MLNRATALLALTLLLAGCGQRPVAPAGDGLRVVSIAPNVTEILYSLGLSNQVVGVSKYSVYPPAAQEKPIVGGTYDPNWEMIVSLRPDLVIGLDSQEEIAAQLKQLDIDFLGVPHERVTEIMQSILIIGEACGAKEQAQQVFQSLEKQLEKVPTIGKNEKPRVLICIGHDDHLTRMYVAAKNTFYDDLITLAGGINACEQTAIKYPEISPEGLRAMKPDLIIDLVPLRQGSGQANPGKKSSNAWKNNGVQAQPASKLWKPYHAVLMTNQYAFIPGPRFGLLLEDFLNVIRQNNLKAE